MLLQDAEHIRQRIVRMAKLSRRLYLFSIVALVLYAAVCIALCVVALGSGDWFSNGGAIALVPLVLSLIIGGMIIYVLSKMLKDVSEQRSPFSLTQARRISFVGILLLVDVVLETLISAGAPLFISSNEVTAGFVSNYTAPGLYINGPFLIATIICFCLSYIFRYGALLQWFTDETV